MAQHLPDLRAALELFRWPGRTNDGVGEDVGQPDLVLLVDVDGVATAAGIARQQPRNYSAASRPGALSQRAAAVSSASSASTQVRPAALSTCFQNGARVFR